MRLAFGYAALLLLPALPAAGHVVPNMTIEAEFARDRSYTLRINLDPRVFLSEQPTSLPPVPAEWYLDQTEAEKTVTHARAMEYLQTHLGLSFGEQKVSLPECSFEALDGATLETLKPESAELHLRASTQGEAPAAARDYTLAFGRDAHVSLILLNSTEGHEEKKPQVIFPGETSSPYPLPDASPPSKASTELPSPALAVGEITVTRSYPDAGKVMLGIGATLLILFAAGAWLIRRSKRG